MWMKKQGINWYNGDPQEQPSPSLEVAQPQLTMQVEENIKGNGLESSGDSCYLGHQGEIRKR